MDKYAFTEIEESMLALWKKNKLREKANAEADKRGKGQKRWYFLDGPPYTSGKIHLGTAWNKALKDMVIRYKRMQGIPVWDRAGYDMHGLPTENATMKTLGLKTKKDIMAFGLDKFINECRTLCVTNLEKMNEDFLRLGVWMDFENAYQTVTRDFMSGEWWLIKRAHEENRLYEGLRTMTWCANTESALAKHELEYKTVTDDSIFVKFKLKTCGVDGKDNANDDEYLVIWTTTPWTIPFNLAVMVGPDIDYVKAKVQTTEKKGKPKEEYWYVANALVGAFLGSVADVKYTIVEELNGTAMEGWTYEHPFYNVAPKVYDEILGTSKKACSILLSSEYVDTSAGSGLVHCAPGCGPEDYEVGHRNGIPPFNNIDTRGVFPEEMGVFAGWIAKKDDAKFINAIDDTGALIASTPVEHEYPHDWRHHEPVIFRTTKQWFFKIEDLKEKLIKENDNIKWMPEAAYRAFDSWLKNLRDNSISKQRFWGCPLPVWRNIAEDAAEDDYLVVGSADELEQLSGQKVADLHISTVDKIPIVKDGKTYRRVPDVLDVWVDAGTTSWNCLDHDPQLMKELFPADFILEGKDQIRGWFNLLHITSMLGLGKPSFKKCYMHGFVNDAQGRKMSKSLGNYILPDEVINKFGADTWRYYSIGSANPGLDMNYNFDDVELKHRNLHVFWNVHKFIVDLQHTSNLVLAAPETENIGAEECFMESVRNKTVRDVTVALEEMRLNEVPLLIEECLLALSRTYIQLVREKAATGSDEEKQSVLWTAWNTYKDCMTMFAIVAPFITEQIYKNIRELEGNPFALDKESIHLTSWPTHNTNIIDVALEQDVVQAGQIISAILAAREKIALGVRWPLSKVMIETQKNDVEHATTSLMGLIMQQANVKEVVLEKAPVTPVVKANFRELGRAFGEKTGAVAEAIKKDADAISAAIGTGTDKFTVEGFELSRSMLDISYEAAKGFVMAEFPGGLLAIKTALTPELEAEGYLRELVRRVQQMRKDAGLEKRDRIVLAVSGEKDLLKRIAEHDDAFQEKVGASKLVFVEKLPEKMGTTKEVTIRGQEFVLGFDQEK